MRYFCTDPESLLAAGEKNLQGQVISFTWKFKKKAWHAR